jgi:hypothetical protein
MVEFPLVGPAERKGFTSPVAEIYLRYHRLLTLILCHQAASDPIGMWETSTFTASFHARLNVAPRAEFLGRGG